MSKHNQRLWSHTDELIENLEDAIRHPDTLPPIPYKYDEAAILKEIHTYIDATYSRHYVSPDKKVQAFDLIHSSGNSMGFCIGSILKYASRFGKKSGHNREDLLKIIHYAMFAMYVQKETK